MEFEKRKAATLASLGSTVKDKSPKGSSRQNKQSARTRDTAEMEFEKRKAVTLASLGSMVTDKSPKGSLDEPIVPLLNTINQHPSYFTTSSCSGRISILSQPKSTSTTTAPSSNPKKKARGGSWLFITHDLADGDSVLSLLFPTESTDADQLHPVQPSELVFRFEPLIIAVESKDLSSAQSMVSIAIACGFRESGITSCGGKRVIIAIRCSIRLEVPLGDTQKMMVSPEYVRFLVGIANEKMVANRKRTDGFLQALRTSEIVGSIISQSGDKLVLNGGEHDMDGHCGEDDNQDEDSNLKIANGDFHCGSVGVPSSTLSISQVLVVGEPIEKLFLWGHSACTLDNTGQKVLVFGGFGGMGRHARRNESLLLDPLLGTLKAINAEGPPSPRLGHTSSLVGDQMFVIGGRADPSNILSDLWVLSIAKNKWKLLEYTGNEFPCRHRHAAAVISSKIFVFGGLNNDKISSSLHVLDTDDLHWKEILAGGEWPSARHSHAMVAYGSQIFMFGGYDGEKALGDLYSFDVQTCLWKKEQVAGRSPRARFSHSMFVYGNFIGIIGGCPVRQHYQELAMLDLQLHMWKHVTLDSIGKELFVRCTANVVGDDLVMIGGGAACYAFGTKFSEPMKINLLRLRSLDNNVMCSQIGENLVTYQNGGVFEKENVNFQGQVIGNASSESLSLNSGAELHPSDVQDQIVAFHWIVQLEKSYAKLGKDILKKFGWLDLKRKVYLQDGGLHICFPVTEQFSAIFHGKPPVNDNEGSNDLCMFRPCTEGISLNKISCSAALDFLNECGATKLVDEAVEFKKTAKTPLQKMNEAVASLIEHKGLSAELLEELPSRWERLGDIVVLPMTSFKDPVWKSIGKELWPVTAKSLNASRLARQGQVASTGTRDSTLEILVGDNGWVDHHENGILYSFDATKCMFSWGNLSEKLRMGCLDCKDEVIVDLFAGIGYFVLPFLVRAKAKLVYACEWNPHAVNALQHNLQANSVSDRCIVLEGDNRITAPKGVADRVCLGLLPTSEGSWVTAVRALRSEGGVLHVHGNVKDSEESLWTKHVSESLNEIASSEGHCWEVTVEHVERVKWYAPHIRHLVADFRCKIIKI